MLNKRNKGIVAQKAEEIEKKVQKNKSNPVKGKSDEQILQESIRSIQAFNNITGGVQGKLVVNLGYIRIYSFVVSRGEGNVVEYTAFIYPMLTPEVLKFLVEAAQHNNITGLTGFAPNAVIARKYKF